MTTPCDLLQVEVMVDGPNLGLVLIGELTYSTVASFTARATDVLDARPPRLVLDVGRLHFCDSVGLSSLIGLHQRAEALGGGVTLSGVHGSLARVLTVTGAAALFDVTGGGAGSSAPTGSGYAGEPA